MSMTHDEMIAVIAAHRDGKKIQNRHNNSPCEWGKVSNPCWNFETYEYRVKPEPVTVWALLDDSGCVNAFYQTEANARFYADKAAPSYRVARMIEAPDGDK